MVVTVYTVYIQLEFGMCLGMDTGASANARAVVSAKEMATV